MEQQRAAGAALAEPAAARDLSATGRAARVAIAARVARSVRAARAALAARSARASRAARDLHAGPAGPCHLAQHILHVAGVIVQHKIIL